MNRTDVLDTAKDIVTGDREDAYGPPGQDFTRTAAILTAMGFQRGVSRIKGHGVAQIMIALKLSRLSWSPGKADSWIDIAGYAACGAEVAGAADDEMRYGNRSAAMSTCGPIVGGRRSWTTIPR